jgi:hypothetical protein
MNDFEGINTGKWLVRETLTSWEAECPVCGFCVPVAVSFDIERLKHKICGLKDFCPSCNEDMFKEEPKLYTDKETVAFGQLDPGAKSLIINCEKIVLEQRSLGITVDISENIDNIDNVEINGAKFVREVK